MVNLRLSTIITNSRDFSCMRIMGTDKLTRKLGQTLPNITTVASYVAESTHLNTTLSLSVAPNTHFSMRKKLTCQYR